MAERIVVGRIRSPYGLQGWVWMDSFTDNPASIFDWKPWTLTRGSDSSSGRPAMQAVMTGPETWKVRGQSFVVRLLEYPERANVEQLVNCLIEVDKRHLPKLEHGEFYWRDLEGCHVETTKNEKLGVVKKVMATGANDVLVVGGDECSLDKTERLIPFIQQTVMNVNVEDRIIVVDWEPGF